MGGQKSRAIPACADWDAIAEIKQAVSIPVIANGDVKTVADIGRILAHTGCDGVMIGRAAIGNPWIFSRRDRQDVPEAMVQQTLVEHMHRMIAFYGEGRGMLLFRKHASRYLRPLELDLNQRRRLFTAEDPVEFLQALPFTHL